MTTGLSSRECLAALREHPGTILGAACLIDRSGGKAKLGVKLHAPNQYLRAAPREASDLFHPAAAG